MTAKFRKRLVNTIIPDNVLNFYLDPICRVYKRCNYKKNICKTKFETRIRIRGLVDMERNKIN